METSCCMKVEIIPLNVNWAIIQLLPLWLLAACMSISGWIKLNQPQSKSKPAIDRFIIISWSWLLISIHSYILSASVVLNPTPPPQLQSIVLDPKSFKSHIQEDPLLGNNKRDIGA